MFRHSVTFDRLVERKAPETGNLVRRDPRPKHSSSSPVLAIPSEVRLLIWKHLLDEVRFIFELEPDGGPRTCYITTPHSKLVSFLQTCRLFRREGRAVIKPTLAHLVSKRGSISRGHSMAGQIVNLKRFPLRLDETYPTVTHLDIEAEWAASICNSPEFGRRSLLQFTKLRTISVLYSTHKNYLRNLLDDDNAVKIKSSEEQSKIIQDLFADDVLPLVACAPWDETDVIPPPLNSLGRVLQHMCSQVRSVAVTVQARIMSHDCSMQDDHMSFPITRQLEQLHIVLEVPSMRLTHLSAGLYNKAIEFAIKQRWTEVIHTSNTDKELRDKLCTYWSNLT